LSLAATVLKRVSGKLREERRLRVLRRVLGPKRNGITGEWGKLHSEELNDLYSPNIVQVIKSRRMRWAGHVACLGVQERRIQGFGGET
jgi:hypothetical protein